jgi:hypothetical protein
MNLERPIAKRAIRYLKRGVFPPDIIQHFTAGKERETKNIADALDEVRLGSSRHYFVEANYGFGKSHMLKVAEALALQRNFAVSWVTINGTEHAFNHPTRYLHSILGNLRAPQVPARGLVELCSHWLANSQRENLLNWAGREAPCEFRWPIERLSAPGGDENNTSNDWYFGMLEGRDLQHKSGCTYFPDFFRRIEATVSLCRAVGCGGVLFLIDEIECIATHLNNIRQRLLSYQVLNSLVDGRRFPHSMFLFATTEDLGTKISSDILSYSEQERYYPNGYRFAKKWHAKELNFLQIKPVVKSDNIKLLRRLCETHSIAYAWRPEQRIEDNFIEHYVTIAARSGFSQREIVKWFVEILEIAHQHQTFCPPLHLHEQT